MFLDKKVKDLLIPLKDCATTHVDKPLREAVDELQKALGALESGEAAEPAAAEDTEEEVPTESDDEQEESSSEEDE
jgi:ribosomal protein L12E/L44/L45/RPP1/RPP2